MPAASFVQAFPEYRWGIPAQFWDHDAGGWTVYDPQTRLASAVVKLQKGVYRFPIAAGGTYDDLNGASAGVTIYRKVKDYRGDVPDPRKPWTARITVFDRTRPRRTTNDGCAIVAGFLSGPPTSAGSKVLKAVGLTHTSTTPMGTMTGTAGATTYSTALDQENARAFSLTIGRTSRQQLCTMCPAAIMDGVLTQLRTDVFTNTTVAQADEGTEIYEFVAIFRVGAGSGTANIDLLVASGTLPDTALPAYYGPSMTGRVKNVLPLGDSTWFGATASVVGGIPYTVVAADYLLTRDWGQPIPAIRWVGGTALSAANAADIFSGQNKFSCASGKALTDLVSEQAATVTALAGQTVPVVADWVIINAGYIDAGAGRTAAQMRADVVTLAAAWAASGATRVFVVAQPPMIAGAAGKAEHDAFCAALLAGAPAGVERVINCNTWWTNAFRDQVTDGHPNLIANPTLATSWDTPLALNPAGADYSQNGCAAVAVPIVEALTGCLFPLATGEVRPNA